MLAKTYYPFWGYMLGLGATTIWERWNSVNLNGTVNTESMNSLNHANLGTCAEWFYRGILGFDMLQPGSRRFSSIHSPPTMPVNLSATIQAGLAGFIMNVGSLVVGRNYVLQSTTNLASGVWTTETNIVATQSAAAFTNSATNYAHNFYRVVGY